MKNAFVMYTEYAEDFEMLDMVQRGVLITAIFSYAAGEDYIIMDPVVKMAFMHIRRQIDRDNEKYNQKVEKNRVNGAKGGRPKKQEVIEETECELEKPKKANGFSENPKKQTDKIETLKDKDKDKDKDNDNEKDKDKEKDKDNEKDNEKVKSIRHKYGEYSHVLLTDEDLEKLYNAYGVEETQEAITYLDEYVERKNYKFKSAYLTLKKWVYDAVREEKNKGGNRASPKGSGYVDAINNRYEVVKEWYQETSSES